jgi:putative ABC transport system ATP-binding protein
MMFAVDRLTKTYRHRGQAIHALDEVSLQIPSGTFVTVTGGSGSGKTTLLLTLGGLIRPTKGKVQVSGKSLYDCRAAQLSAYRNRTVGFVLQTFHLVPYLTALENVMVPMLLTENNPRVRERKATGLLDKMGLPERRGFLPRELSVGQQQRVAIARALANNPAVVLADEPTGNLDPALSLEILGALDDLNRREGRTIVMVTHSPIAAKYGSQHFHLEQGKLSNVPRAQRA